MGNFKHEKAKEIIKKHGAIGVVFVIFAGLCFAAFFAFLFGGIVKHLWNYTISDIFNIPNLTYLQAVALIVLSRLLFGGFGGCSSKSNVKGHVHQKMQEKYCNDNEHWNSDLKEGIDKVVNESLTDKK